MVTGTTRSSGKAGSAALVVALVLASACTTRSDHVASRTEGVEVVGGLTVTPSAMWVDGETLYLAESNRILTCPKDACTALTTAFELTGEDAVERFLGARGRWLGFTTSSGLGACSRDGCRSTFAFRTKSGVKPSWSQLSETGAYFNDDSVAGGRLQHVTFGSGEVVDVVGKWACESLLDCPAERPACVTTTGECRACTSNAGSPQGVPCPSRFKSICDGGACRACKPEDCAAPLECIRGVCGVGCGSGCAAGTFCDAQTCVPLRGPNESCASKDECSGGRLCIDGRCGARLGAACASFEECASQRCVGANPSDPNKTQTGKCEPPLETPPVPVPLDLARRFATGQDELFLATKEKVYACPLTGPCSLSAARVVLEKSDLRLLGAVAGDVFFASPSGRVAKCVADRCEGSFVAVGTVEGALEGATAAGASAVVVADSFVACVDGSCAPVEATAAPDRSVIGPRTTTTARAGAFDGEVLYWATPSFLGARGVGLARKRWP